jgi:hypothetical protein
MCGRRYRARPNAGAGPRCLDDARKIGFEERIDH